METKHLYTTWLKATGTGTFESIFSSQLFNHLIELYTGPNRFYHNISHVQSILDEIPKHQLSIDQQWILILSAFYHDAIYTPGSKKNEIKSADLARKDLSLLEITEEIIQAVSLVIANTANRESRDYLSKLFNDMDMAILGKNPETYKIYSSNIRKEHSAIPSILYQIGRKKFLSKLLEQEFIFQTELYRDKLESMARINITNELKKLL